MTKVRRMQSNVIIDQFDNVFQWPQSRISIILADIIAFVADKQFD